MNESCQYITHEIGNKSRPTMLHNAVRPTDHLSLKIGVDTLQKAIFNSENFSSIATDEKGVIQIFNVGAERMLGYSSAEMINKSTPAEISDQQEMTDRAKALSREFNTNIAPGFEALVYKASRGIEDIYELSYIRKDGSRFPAVVSVTALRKSTNDIIGYLITGTNNTSRKAEKNKLLLSDAALKAISEGVVITDADGLTIYANSAFLSITEYSIEELYGKKLSLLQGRMTDTREIDKIRRAVRIGGYYAGDILNYKKDGTAFWHQIRISPIVSNDKSNKYHIGITQDITERKNSDDENKKNAYLDYLTNLPNKRLLHDRLRQLIANNRRTGNYSAMILIDLDNFKQMNDTLGHEAGDLLLIETSNRLMLSTRESDTVARIGGDEFIVLLKDINQDKDLAYAEAMAVAEKIKKVIGEKFIITDINNNNTEYSCTASIGLIIFTCPSIAENKIIKYADSAMYKSKKDGKNLISIIESKELDPFMLNIRPLHQRQS